MASKQSKRRLRRILYIGVWSAFAAPSALGQVPDLVNAYDAGGRSLGMGGALHGVEPSSASAYYNPASLGYITKGEVDLALHNLSNSETAVTGTRSNPVYSTHGRSGSSAVTDFGVSVPAHPIGGKGTASIALNYNVGGYVHDVATGPISGLTDGTNLIAGYLLQRQVRTDFVTLAYGQANSSKTFSLGAGVVYAQNELAYVESGAGVSSAGSPVPFGGANIDYKSTGVGFIVGMQFIPECSPNFSLGLSYRSPISLSGANSTAAYDRIPARVLANASYRIDGRFSGNDYAVLGAQYQYFYGGKRSVYFDRETQNVYGVGLEYNHLLSDLRIPLRLGYAYASAGGLGFQSYEALTYGFGVRPADSKYSIDFNWTTARGGGKDFGISAGYRFGK